MKLSDILDFEGDFDIEIKGIAYHSGLVKTGDAFFAMKGALVDGHKYIKMAEEKGATVAIVEEKIEGIKIPQIVVEDSRKALADCSCRFFGHPSQKLKMIGVTATNGKTTTTYMIRSIIEEAGKKTGFIGTVLIDNGKDKIASHLTTPESRDLQKQLSLMVGNGLDTCIMEVSSSAIEMGRIRGTEYDIVAFNNIAREHLDVHGSFENYLGLKSGLVKNLPKNATAVISYDEPLIKKLKDETLANVLTFSVTDDGADIFARNLDLSTGMASFDLCIRDLKTIHSVRTKLRVAGFHSVVNALSSAGVAYAYGISPDIISRGLENFSGVERRFEQIYDGDFKIFDDHFANEANIDITLKTLEMMKYNRLHILYAIRGNRGSIINTENALAIVRWAKKLGLKDIVITLSRDYSDYPKDYVTDEEIRIHHEIIDPEINTKYFDNLSDAADEVLTRVGKDDVLLLCGSQGMDFGANVVLHKIARSLGDESILKPLENRVAGV